MILYIVKYAKNTIKLIFEKLLCLFFLVIIASIVAEHYTGNILYKGNQFNTKVDYFLGVDRD